MKGLLLKDLYLALKHFKGYIVLVAVFALLSVADTVNMFFVFYPSLLCGMIPVNLMAYDEQSKWNMYTAVLPITRAQVVASRYIVGLIVQGIILLLVTVVNAVRMIASGGMDWNYLQGIMGILILMSSLTTAIPLPFIFSMGVEKGRIGYAVSVGLAAGGSAIVAGFLGNRYEPVVFPEFGFPVLLLTGIAVYAFSWYLSVELYEKRDL